MDEQEQKEVLSGFAMGMFRHLICHRVAYCHSCSGNSLLLTSPLSSFPLLSLFSLTLYYISVIINYDIPKRFRNYVRNSGASPPSGLTRGRTIINLAVDNELEVLQKVILLLLSSPFSSIIFPFTSLGIPLYNSPSTS